MKKVTTQNCGTLYSKRLFLYLLLINMVFIANAQTFDKKNTFSPNEAYIKLNGTICLNLTINEIKEELEELKEIDKANPITRAHLFTETTESKHCQQAYLLWRVKISENRNFLDQLNRIKEHALVELITPLNGSSTLYIPNDPSTDTSLSHNYGASNVLKGHNFFDAWDIERGDTNVYIGIVDAGFNLNHEDLKDAIKHNFADPINGLNDDNDYYNNNSSLPLTDNFSGWDLAEWDNDPTQPQGTGEHGTLIAGVAAATADNGKGIVGTALNSKFVPYKVSPDSDGNYILYGYEGIIMAAEQGCKVINCSWGSPASIYEDDTREIYQSIINYAVFVHDAVIIAAAGNENAEKDYFPAALDNVCSITATTPGKRKLNRSCYGYSIDISAVGWNVVTTAHDADNSSYKLQLGTSIAAPAVAGAAALVRSHFPEMSALEVIEQLKRTGDIIDTLDINSNLKNKIGTYLNPYNALTNTQNPTFKVLIDSTNHALYASDTLKVYIRVKNMLWESTENTTCAINSTNPNLVVSENTSSSILPAMDYNDISLPFRVDIILQQDIIETTDLTLLFNFDYEGKQQYDYKNLQLKAEEIVTSNFIATNENLQNIYVSDLESFILINSENENITHYQLTDLMGFTILNKELSNKSTETRVDKSQLTKNRIYLLSITTENTNLPVVKKIYVR